MKKDEKKENPLKDYDKTNRNFESPNSDNNKDKNSAQKLQPEKYPVEDKPLKK